MTFSSRLRYTASYIAFLRRSDTKYGVHSPFVYDLITKVLQDHTHFPEYERAEEIRNQCLDNKLLIEISNFESSGQKSSSDHEYKQVRNIARSAMTRRSGRLLYRLVRYFAPGTVLELGTSLGIGTIYMACVAPAAEIITLEACQATAELTRENLIKAGVQNVTLLVGDFSGSLTQMIQEKKTIGFASFDGNHSCNVALAYFRQCLLLHDENSVFVYHHIHCSQGMEEAWSQICSHPQVSVSIDLFELGLIFFKKGLSKQDFVIRF